MSKVKTYPGADANSDHNPVVATIKLHLKKLKPPQKREPKFMFNALKISDVRNKFNEDVIAGVQECEPLDSPTGLWKNLKDAMIEAANKHIPKEKWKGKHNNWMNKEIKDLMQKDDMQRMTQ